MKNTVVADAFNHSKRRMTPKSLTRCCASLRLVLHRTPRPLGQFDRFAEAIAEPLAARPDGASAGRRIR